MGTSILWHFMFGRKNILQLTLILITVSFGAGATVRKSVVIYFRSILTLMPCNYATLPLVYVLKLYAVKGTNNKLQRSLFNFFSLHINRYKAMYSWPQCISLSFTLAQHILDDCFWCCASAPGGQIVGVNCNQKGVSCQK